MPEKWQARQAIPAILQISSSKHNAKEITTREKEKQFTNLHMLQSTCFGTKVDVCVCAVMKKRPNEWQAQQAVLAILQVRISKHNTKSKRPVSSVDHSHPYRGQKREALH